MTTTTTTETSQLKMCSVCGETKPVDEFLRRTGRRSGQHARRGTCRSCMKIKAKTPRPVERLASLSAERLPARTPERTPPRQAERQTAAHADRPPKRSVERALTRTAERPRSRIPESAGHAVANPSDAAALIPTRQGYIRMRGRTDKGRRWYQEIDLDLAVTLVRERAAVLVNRHTIRRLFSNKDFRKHILIRDKHTCHFCGQYGDTIDHLLPRSKGGHTTPDNCVCACNECNQSKANRDLEEFVGALK
jgi:hypothetical protein